MKKTQLTIIAVILAVMAFFNCVKEDSEGDSPNSLKFDKDTSYAFGMAYGGDIRDNIDSGSYRTDYKEFMKGFTDGFYEKETRLSIEEAMVLIQTAFRLMSEDIVAKRQQEEITFLAGNSRKNGVIITPSGLQYEIIKEGNGPKPSAKSTVLVHYKGTYVDGSVFDSSYQRGEPLEINLDEVIPGWTEGLQLMSVGSNYILYIPSELGYGPDGRINPLNGMQAIPQYATLIFDIELIGIIN